METAWGVVEVNMAPMWYVVALGLLVEKEGDCSVILHGNHSWPHAAELSKGASEHELLGIATDFQVR